MEFKNVESIFENKVKELNAFQLNSRNVIKILKIAIEVVEFLDNDISGKEKKNLVIQMIKKYIQDDNEISDVEKNICLEMINSGTIDETIDLVVDASNGNLDLNNVLNLGTSCCAILLKNLLQKKDKKKLKKRKKILVN